MCLCPRCPFNSYRCPLSGTGPGPAPSRPRKWKPGGKGEGWQSNTPLTPAPHPPDFSPTRESQVELTTGPQQPQVSTTREEDMWGAAAGTQLFFSSLCSTPCILLKGMLRGTALRKASGSQPSAPGSGGGRERHGGLWGDGASASPHNSTWALGYGRTAAWRAVGGDPLEITESSVGGWSVVRCGPQRGGGPLSAAPPPASPPLPPRPPREGDRGRDRQGRRAYQPGQVQRPRVWGPLRPEERPGLWTACTASPRPLSWTSATL